MEWASAICGLYAPRAKTIGATAQESYKVRLAPVAADLAMRENIAGSGMVTVALSGTRLTLSGTFEGLKGNATAASIHQGSATGVRGKEVLALAITKAASGTVLGSFDLTADQLDALKKGKWYVQIDSEKTTEGNLWGWIWKCAVLGQGGIKLRPEPRRGLQPGL